LIGPITQTRSQKKKASDLLRWSASMRYAIKAMITALVVGMSLIESVAAGPFEDGVAAYQRGDYLAAMRFFRPIADQGNGDAQYNLGLMYDKGLGVRTDAPTAANWYRKAANLGIADAQCDLGILYAEGRGVPRDYAAAVGWFQRAADQGDARAQWSLGTMYIEGHGVVQSYAEAMKWNRKAADQGFADAQQNVGTMYAKGQGVPKDAAEAVKWYQLSADQGLASAQFMLGYKYAVGDGVPPNPPEAVKWLRKAADQKYPNAQTVLNVVYKVLREQSKDPALVMPKATPNLSADVNEQRKAGSGYDPNAATTANRMTASNSAVLLGGDDLPNVVSTYRENEMRFKRDFLGKKFSDVLPFLKATEKLFSKDDYRVSFGTGKVLGDLDCTVASPAEISEIANWNKGDKIHVEGIVKDVTMGSVHLDPCSLSK
jgi:TPR repeat protein